MRRQGDNLQIKGVSKGTHGVMSVKEISRRKPVNRSNWRGKALKEGEQSCSMSLA